jgi:hypothetical protein
MSQGNTVNKNNQGNSDGQDSTCQDRWERRRELRRELRELRYRDPWHGLFAGLILLLAGCLFLAANLFDVDFAKWWPVIPMLVGVAILARVFYRQQ